MADPVPINVWVVIHPGIGRGLGLQVSECIRFSLPTKSNVETPWERLIFEFCADHENLRGFNRTLFRTHGTDDVPEHFSGDHRDRFKVRLLDFASTHFGEEFALDCLIGYSDLKIPNVKKLVEHQNCQSVLQHTPKQSWEASNHRFNYHFQLFLVEVVAAMREENHFATRNWKRWAAHPRVTNAREIPIPAAADRDMVDVEDESDDSGESSGGGGGAGTYAGGTSPALSAADTKNVRALLDCVRQEGLTINFEDDTGERIEPDALRPAEHFYGAGGKKKKPSAAATALVFSFRSAVCSILRKHGSESWPSESEGSGFLVRSNPAIIFTCFHVLYERENATAVVDVWKPKNGSFRCVFEDIDPIDFAVTENVDNVIYPLKGKRSAVGYDVAIVDLKRRVNVIPISLTAIFTLLDPETVVNIGKKNLQDCMLLYPSWDGKKTIVTYEAGLIWDYRYYEMIYNVDTQAGHSGSPVFDMSGNLIAIHRASFLRVYGGKCKLALRIDKFLYQFGIRAPETLRVTRDYISLLNKLFSIPM